VLEQKELENRIRLLRCTQDGRATKIEPFNITGPLFADPEIQDALKGPDDASSFMHQALVRGWL